VLVGENIYGGSAAYILGRSHACTVYLSSQLRTVVGDPPAALHVGEVHEHGDVPREVGLGGSEAPNQSRGGAVSGRQQRNAIESHEQVNGEILHIQQDHATSAS
jgi:hypothetical protein